MSRRSARSSGSSRSRSHTASGMRSRSSCAAAARERRGDAARRSAVVDTPKRARLMADPGVVCCITGRSAGLSGGQQGLTLSLLPIGPQRRGLCVAWSGKESCGRATVKGMGWVGWSLRRSKVGRGDGIGDMPDLRPRVPARRATKVHLVPGVGALMVLDVVGAGAGPWLVPGRGGDRVAGCGHQPDSMRRGSRRRSGRGLRRGRPLRLHGRGLRCFIGWTRWRDGWASG